MSDLRPKPVSVSIGGREYGLLFDLNAIDEIQDRLDISISQIGELLTGERRAYKAIKAILAVLINEAADAAGSPERVTEAQIGRMLTAADVPRAADAIVAAFTVSMPEPEEDADPNSPSG
jgi:hypothetical protein